MVKLVHLTKSDGCTCVCLHTMTGMQEFENYLHGRTLPRDLQTKFNAQTAIYGGL